MKVMDPALDFVMAGFISIIPLPSLPCCYEVASHKSSVYMFFVPKVMCSAAFFSHSFFVLYSASIVIRMARQAGICFVCFGVIKSHTGETR